MNIVQKKLVEAYATLVMGNKMSLEDGTELEAVPVSRVIGGVEYPIRSEVELEIARRRDAVQNP